MVKRGVIQVMEGRHCFEHLTVEENLMTGAYTRKESKKKILEDLEMDTVNACSLPPLPKIAIFIIIFIYLINDK